MNYIDTNSEEYRFLYGRNNAIRGNNSPIFDSNDLPKEDNYEKHKIKNEQSNYFVQGEEESNDTNTIDPLDAGLLINVNANPLIPLPNLFVNAILFDGQRLPAPNVQPADINIQVIGGAFAPPENVPPYVPPPVPPNALVRENYIRRESLAQPLIFQGLRIFAETFVDAIQPLRIRQRQVNGKAIRYFIQPSQYTSPSNILNTTPSSPLGENPTVIDIPDFGFVLDSHASMVVPKQVGSAFSNSTNKFLQFTSVRQSELSNNFFSRSVVRSLKAKRPLGIPMYDENRNKTYHIIKNNPYETKPNEI